MKGKIVMLFSKKPQSLTWFRPGWKVKKIKISVNIFGDQKKVWAVVDKDDIGCYLALWDEEFQCWTASSDAMFWFEEKISPLRKKAQQEGREVFFEGYMPVEVQSSKKRQYSELSPRCCGGGMIAVGGGMVEVWHTVTPGIIDKTGKVIRQFYQT